MSFSNTPLGQGRRLDHRTFLNKNPPQQNISKPVPRRQVPTAYSFGAPTAAVRSPPKVTPANTLDDSDPPALIRFERLKKQQQQQQQPQQASPHPEKWAVKDTSVQIASAFQQAASTSAEDSMHPNDAWASGANRNVVPRNTSVEYEKETQTIVNRRLAPPRRPVHRPNGQAADSSVEEQPSSRFEREKSPFAPIIDTARNIARAAEYYLRPPEDTSGSTNGTVQNTSSSYEYVEEEQEYQQQTQSSKATSAHRRNRISVDNKAYKPTVSDLDETDDDYDEDDRRRGKRRTKKGAGAGPPLTTLPVAGYDKRRRRAKGQKVDGDEESSEEGQASYSIEQGSVRGTTPQPRAPSLQPSRMSVPPRASSVTRDASYNTTSLNDTFDVEEALRPNETLESILEEPENEKPPDISDQSIETEAPFSIGATLGKAVYSFFSLVWRLSDLLLLKPLSIASQLNFALLLKYLSAALAVYAMWYALQNGYYPSLPGTSRHVPYRPPEMPPQDVSELSDRLQRLESALASLSVDSERSRTYIEGDARSQAELIGRLGALENQIRKESSRVVDMENRFRATATQGLESVQREIDYLRHQLQARPQNTGDEEARAKLRALEERVGTVEGGVQEALEVAKTKAEIKPATWWKSSDSPSTVTIKSTDGQDVGSLINELVDSAVSKFSKDVIAKTDYALHSAGARVIPHLTSETFELRPHGLVGQIVGTLTGNGYAIGRPPVTALHHDLHPGHCWPLVGSTGQLAVALAAPVYITEVTIDHVPKETALDMRNAPRQMELWGLVEGQENLDKYKAWKERKARKEEAELSGGPLDGATVEQDEQVPPSLLESAPFIRIANFTYDVRAPRHIQTFPVSQEIQDLGVDFGIVVLLIKNNWGRQDLTCLYRLRVHGQRLGGNPLPHGDEEHEESSQS